MMAITQLIENNFSTIEPGKKLGDLMPLIASSSRNIFPVVNAEGDFKGHVLFDDIRSVMFNADLYDKPIEDYMVEPSYIIDPQEPMEQIVAKFTESGKYNIPVVKDGKYLGYISRANVFSAYRKTLSEISDE